MVKLNTTTSDWGVNYVLATQVSSFSTFHFSSANAALPVTLLDFTATSKTRKQYQFIDAHPTIGMTLFYRLKMVDLDDKFTYSNIVTLTSVGSSGIIISPNPLQNTLTLEGAGQFSQMQIIDASGRIVRQVSSNASNQYDVSDLKQGVYSLRLINNKKVVVVRFVKL